MISTSRQASVSRKRREELLRAAEDVPSDNRSTYLKLADQISRELEEYDAIRHGAINVFRVQEIDDLGEALVKARLAKGWTQRQLAEALQVSDQMVQKDESRAYENAGLARIAEVADVLGYNLEGSLQPVHLPSDLWKSDIFSVSATAFAFEITPSLVTPMWTSPEVFVPMGWMVPGYLNVSSLSSTKPTSGEIMSSGYFLGQGGVGPTGMHLLAPVGAVQGETIFNSTTAITINKLSGAAS